MIDTVALMSLPRKKSRPIVVDGQPYRWGIVPRDESEALLVIERDTGGASQLRIHGPNSLKPGYVLGPDQTLTPARVADWVRHALAAGWDPNSKGNQVMNGGTDWAIARSDRDTARTPSAQEMRRAGFKVPNQDS